MSNAVHHIPQQEYWTPPREGQAAALNSRVEACDQCGTEFVLGSRFCHVCGAQREALIGSSDSSFIRWLDFSHLKESLGLTAGSLVAFIVGLACVVAAVATGLIYSAATLLDWQAVQIWRIEWLLAGLAAFAVGILLKSK